MMRGNQRKAWKTLLNCILRGKSAKFYVKKNSRRQYGKFSHWKIRRKIISSIVASTFMDYMRKKV